MNNIQGRLVLYLVGFAMVFVILGGIRASAAIINPILLALVITITVLPLPSRLTKRGMSGWLALTLTVVLVLVILGLIIVTVFFSITKLTTTLPIYMNDVAAQATEDLSTTGIPEINIQVDQVVGRAGPLAMSLLAGMGSILVQFGMVLLIFFFMISAAISMPSPSRMGLNPGAPGVGRVAEITQDVRKYMTVLTGINFLVGAGNTVFLLIMGVDYALLWGLLAWFMGYIPSVGFLIALIPPVLLAYAQYGLSTALIVLLGYIVINGGVQNFVQPKIMGQSLKISPVVVFVGLFVWGYLLGGIGAILSVPMTLLLLIFMEMFPGTREIAVLMRYTGEEKKEERQAAAKTVRSTWDKVRDAVRTGGADKPAKKGSGAAAGKPGNSSPQNAPK
jgi:AI-2 transport protein TqsA